MNFYVFLVLVQLIMSKMMKAVFYNRYGSPEVLEVDEAHHHSETGRVVGKLAISIK